MLQKGKKRPRGDLEPLGGNSDNNSRGFLSVFIFLWDSLWRILDVRGDIGAGNIPLPYLIGHLTALSRRPVVSLFNPSYSSLVNILVKPTFTPTAAAYCFGLCCLANYHPPRYMHMVIGYISVVTADLAIHLRISPTVFNVGASSHAFRYESHNKNMILSRIELTSPR